MVEFKKHWISKYMTQDQIKNISEVVRQAEEKTSGEIVTVIVRRSSAIAHVKWILSAVLTLIYVIFKMVYGTNHWDQTSFYWEPVLVVFLIYMFSRACSEYKWVQRVLTSNSDEIWQTQNRAELEFYRTQVKKTQKRTGILLFVSWMEKRAVVLADEGIARHYPQEVWDEVVKLMTQEFKKGDLYAGFEKAIKKCGEILQSKLPAAQHNGNELANHLIIKD